MVSERQYKNVCSKVKKHCAHIRVRVRKEKADKLRHLVKKYGNISKAKSTVPEELAEFGKCKIFNSDMSANATDGVEIVLREGEVIKLSECEKAISLFSLVVEKEKRKERTNKDNNNDNKCTLQYIHYIQL